MTFPYRGSPHMSLARHGGSAAPLDFRRPPGHITETIRELERWAEARERLNHDPDRHGKRLDTKWLRRAARYLTEYRQAAVFGFRDDTI